MLWAQQMDMSECYRQDRLAVRDVMPVAKRPGWRDLDFERAPLSGVEVDEYFNAVGLRPERPNSAAPPIPGPRDLLCQCDRCDDAYLHRRRRAVGRGRRLRLALRLLDQRADRGRCKRLHRVVRARVPRLMGPAPALLLLAPGAGCPDLVVEQRRAPMSRYLFRLSSFVPHREGGRTPRSTRRASQGLAETAGHP